MLLVEKMISVNSEPMLEIFWNQSWCGVEGTERLQLPILVMPIDTIRKQFLIIITIYKKQEHC